MKGQAEDILSVSIVVYAEPGKNTAARDPILERAIFDVVRHPFCDVVVILDNSPVRNFGWTAELSPKVLYLHFSGSNLGYGRAHNVARYLTNCRYHLVLNPDIVFLEPDCLPGLLTILEEEPDLAMIQPLIVSPDGQKIQPLCKRNPTFLSQVGRGLLGWPYRRFLASYERWYVMGRLAYGDRPVESPYLSGCFMLCRRRCLDEVDWFDPRFFMYLEDADLTRRLSTVGRCVHEPRLRVGHVWAKGSHHSLRLKLVAIASYFRYGAKWGYQLY